MFNMRFIVSCNLVDYNEQTKGTVLSNQRDGSFGLFLVFGLQKNRPFGLWLDSHHFEIV